MEILPITNHFDNKKMNDAAISSVCVSDIVSNRYQPRSVFCDEAIQELAASIRDVGLLHPPLVRPLVGTDQFEIISGERRVMACRLLGWTTMPVCLRTGVESIASAKAALVENMQRVDLNPIEIAKAASFLIEEFGCTQEEVAGIIGKKRSTVANFLRLLHLSESMQRAISDETISMAHAKVLLSCPGAKRMDLFTLMQRECISVRQAQAYVSKVLRGKTRKRDPDLHEKELVRRLERHFGTKVELHVSKNKGKVSVYFYSLDELDHIVGEWLK